MIRVVNFTCVALTGLSILALYQISEKTRVTRVELSAVETKIAGEQNMTHVLETEWQRVATLKRIQTLAQSKLGMGDTATVEYSALELLPRRGEDNAPLNNSEIKQASAQVPTYSHPTETTSGY